MTLLTLVVVASGLLNSPCAVISNEINVATWKPLGAPAQRATYRDEGERLVYSRRVPRIVREAAATLPVGPRGFKVRLVCNIG